MKKIVTYNLELMTAIFAVVFLLGLWQWAALSLVQKIALGFILLFTLHEWEESRFPGGFYKIFFSKCPIDPSIREETMHLPVAIYLLVILLLPLALDNVLCLILIPIVLALFEGFIHTAGIFIHQLKKPYSPGMTTAWVLFAYALLAISRLKAQFHPSPSTWILGILLMILSFAIMETRFLKAAGLTPREFQSAMKAHMLTRLRRKK